MFTDLRQIEKILSKAQNIYSSNEEGKRVMLVYNDWHLITSTKNGLSSRSISDVARITFNYDLNAWQIEWK